MRSQRAKASPKPEQFPTPGEGMTDKEEGLRRNPAPAGDDVLYVCGDCFAAYERPTTCEINGAGCVCQPIPRWFAEPMLSPALDPTGPQATWLKVGPWAFGRSQTPPGSMVRYPRWFVTRWHGDGGSTGFGDTPWEALRRVIP